jgi:HSP20 family protein
MDMTVKHLFPVAKKDASQRGEEHPIMSLRREMDSMFDNFFRGFGFEPAEGAFPAFSPKIDVTDTEKEIRVYAELPGIDERDIDVSITKDTLTIRGEKKEESEKKEKDYHRIERSYGSFSRTIHLPVEIEADKIDAQLKKGVLTITLPKSVKAVEDTKKIQVKVE